MNFSPFALNNGIVFNSWLPFDGIQSFYQEKNKTE